MVQTHSAIPFPSSPSRSMHASPTSSSQWDTPSNQAEYTNLFNTPTPTQASQHQHQQQKLHVQGTPERPSQPHTPLTPPLTPASAPSISMGPPGLGLSPDAPPEFSTPAPTPSSTGIQSHSHSQSMGAIGPSSPVTVGTGSGTSSGWPAPNSPQSQRSRPLPHRLDVGGGAGSGIGPIGSPRSERSEVLSESDFVIPGDSRDGHSAQSVGGAMNGGERYLCVANVPNDATRDQLQDAFRPCGDVKGICLRFQEAQGIVILAFHDCRHTGHAERQVAAQGQTYFDGRRLRAERMGAERLRNLMGESDFVDETEGEVVVTAEGSIDANSLQSIVSGFGELRAFSQANVSSTQTFIAEYFDCRNAKTAMDSLNGRSIFGIRLRLVPLHTAPSDLRSLSLSARIPFPDGGRATHGSQPPSPLTTNINGNNNFVYSHGDQFQYREGSEGAGELESELEYDTSNSSPFHRTHALPSPGASGGASRRISTGSVGVLPGGTSLHQSTSEQDLRRRAAANNSASHVESGQEGWADHVRRTSDTFCFDALRRAAVEASGSGRQGGEGRGGGGYGAMRARARAISDSSASPRLVSPSEGFSTAGMDVSVYGEPAPAPSNGNGARSGYRDERESEMQMHTRVPTASDSSYGGPHTPSPGPMPYGYGANAYPAVHQMHHAHPQAAMLGLEMQGMLAPPHNGQYYLSSPMVPPHAHGVRYGYAPPSAGMGAGYSPGVLSIPSSSSSASSLHSPSASGYSPHALAHPGSSSSPISISSSGVAAAGPGPGHPTAERNQVDLERIAAGIDTRTTVMIKNIPNKLSDKDLVEFIGRVCPRKIDFLYLRMDFQNGCNVGYAFVNFIHVQDLLHFARTKLGVKWNMFSSEKVLQMSYANYQGKEALVEKFKNSCVMDEREAWRPKIFYSTGAQQGLPEPFPTPTHFRRKERSAQNRGALFTPGAGGGGGGGMLGAPFRRPNQHPQNLARQERY